MALKKIIRLVSISIVFLLVLIFVVSFSKYEMTTLITQDKTEIDNALSSGFKMYSNGEINSDINNKTFLQENNDELINKTNKNYSAKFKTLTTISYDCMIPFYSPINFNTKVDFNWSIKDTSGIVKTDTDKFMIQGELKFYGYRTNNYSQRIISQGISKQVEEEIEKIIEIKRDELK